MRIQNHPFFGYLVALACEGDFNIGLTNRYYDAATEGLSALGLDLDSASLAVIQQNLPRFETGGDLRHIQLRTNYCISALKKLCEYLKHVPNKSRTHPFYGYLVRLAEIGKFQPVSINQYFDAAVEGLAGLGLHLYNVTVEDIDKGLPRFKKGGDLYSIQLKNHTSHTSLGHLRDYLEAIPNQRPRAVIAAVASPAANPSPHQRVVYEDPKIADLPFLGDDSDCQHVKYDSNIPQGRRVPGLAEYLESRYGPIIEFLLSVLQIDDVAMKHEPRKIPVILKEDKPVAVYPIDSKAWVLKQWEIRGEGLCAEEIIKMLKTDEREVRILGRYVGKNGPSESHIELYYTNTDCRDKREYLTLFESVLAHEYTHHIHHCYLDKLFWKDSSTAEVVRESIADFASYLYLLTFPGDPLTAPVVANHMLYEWEHWLGSGWPYAEAYWFFYINQRFVYDLSDPFDRDNAEAKLRTVFKASTNYSNALSELHK